MNEAIEKIRRQRDGIKKELEDVAPFTFTDHKHLDADTPERAYYHYGYICALSDVLRQLEPNTEPK